MIKRFGIEDFDPALQSEKDLPVDLEVESKTRSAVLFADKISTATVAYHVQALPKEGGEMAIIVTGESPDSQREIPNNRVI